VLKEEPPCRNCRKGLHRICTESEPIPTILAYLKRSRSTAETLTCCDRKEIWTHTIYA